LLLIKLCKSSPTLGGAGMRSCSFPSVWFLNQIQ